MIVGLGGKAEAKAGNGGHYSARSDGNSSPQAEFGARSRQIGISESRLHFRDSYVKLST